MSEQGITPKVWRQACENAGLWTPGQMCSVDQVTCRHPDERWFETDADIDARRWAKHEIPPPPLGDPATVLAMLEWLVRRMGGVEIETWGRNGFYIGEQVDNRDFPARIVPQTGFITAIVLACAALPGEDAKLGSSKEDSANG